MLEMKEWDGFEGRLWKEEINVRQFIQDNYTPYDGNEDFLAEPTEATNKLWGALQKLQKEERAKGGVLDMETEVVTGITAYGPGYIDESLKDLETIVGLQTDKPLKRAFMPYGGIKMAVQACETYGYQVSDQLKEIFTKYHKTHNTAVFDAYTPEMMKVRHNKILTGLPDTYGRGRIVGDYRRVALYGIDHLIEEKKKDKANCGCGEMTDNVIRLREEIAEQIKCLEDMKKLAEIYGYDISRPATNAKEAVQWLYFGYLAAIKTQNGAAMSVGRVSTFLDIYFERDLKKGIITEQEVQELVDHFTMKLRMVKFARIPSYNQLFSGDPVWATLDVAGTGVDGRSMVTKSDFRFLHTLENMGPAPEPNLTVLYSSRLPEAFKDYAARISIDTSSIQYENDDAMKPVWGDDYAICCCVSATQTGKEMQFFGARANLAKNVGANVLVSFHLNTANGTARGVEVYYPNSNYNAQVGGNGQALAKKICDKLAALGLNYRGTLIRNASYDKYPDGSAADYYGLIRRCKNNGIPGLIIEHAFLDNANDYYTYLSSDEKLKALGVADATAIAEYFGLTKGAKTVTLNYTQSRAARPSTGGGKTVEVSLCVYVFLHRFSR